MSYTLKPLTTRNFGVVLVAQRVPMQVFHQRLRSGALPRKQAQARAFSIILATSTPYAPTILPTMWASALVRTASLATVLPARSKVRVLYPLHR